MKCRDMSSQSVFAEFFTSGDIGCHGGILPGIRTLPIGEFESRAWSDIVQLASNLIRLDLRPHEEEVYWLKRHAMVMIRVITHGEDAKFDGWICIVG